MTSIQLANELEYICIDMRQISSRVESTTLAKIANRLAVFLEKGHGVDDAIVIEQDVRDVIATLKNKGNHHHAFLLSVVLSDLSYFFHKLFGE